MTKDQYAKANDINRKLNSISNTKHSIIEKINDAYNFFPDLLPHGKTKYEITLQELSIAIIKMQKIEEGLLKQFDEI